MKTECVMSRLAFQVGCLPSGEAFQLARVFFARESEQEEG
jgi:hypothetical protein